MYPKLWEASGIPYSQLLDRLIELALERHREKSRTQFTYSPAATNARSSSRSSNPLDTNRASRGI